MTNIALFASGSGSNVENIFNFFKGNEKVFCKLVFVNKKDAFVVERANKLKIPVVHFSKDQFYNTNYILEILEINKIDLIVLAGFLWLVPSQIIAAFNNRIINIHPALLPKYGGKGMYGDNVHKAVVDNREKETGITIHYVDEKYDNGSIIFQKKVEVNPDDDYKAIASKVHQLEYEYFPQIIEKVLNSTN